MSNIKDIFNRPPAISEDTLQYTLYPPSDLSDRVSVTTLATVMQEYTESLLPGHLWHRDPFQLKVAADPDGEGWLLEGRMRVGDSLDDEWCAVWLLREISAKWDVAISIFDSDGEFLLIEAAEQLPSWVTPSNAENRVWVYKSHLQLIPLSYVSPPSSKPRRPKYARAKDSDDEGEIGQLEEEDYITTRDALKVLRDPAVNTLAPPNVEQAVWSRIQGYPSAARQHIHFTKAWLPVDIAKALLVNPALVQKPVETFYTRDAMQLRAAHRMSRFPPEPSTLTTVKMTRTAYAQLVGQKFSPPKVFGRWPEREGTREWRWRDIGMKIACGFEMLYQESKARAVDTSPESAKSSLEARKDALQRNPEYTKYIQNLVSSGYFRGEREGSQLWNELEDKAAAAFIEARREDDATRTSFASEVNAAITQAGEAPFLPQQEEDPDEWLNVNPEDFDSMLETLGKKSQKKPQAEASPIDIAKAESEETEEDRMAKHQAARLQDLAKKVEDFVEGEGDIEGARFADEPSSEDELSDEKFDEESDQTDEEGDVKMSEEPDEGQRAARQAAMDKLVPGIEPSEYGKMPPSFHSGSQRVAPITMETETREELPAKGDSASAGPLRKPIRPPILPRDKYEGVDSDDETDEEGENAEDEEEEEDRPQVVGEVEIDMEEEEDEFLEFAREALGVSNQEWGDILSDRKSRGAFVPTHVSAESKASKKKTTSVPSAEKEPTAGRTPSAGPRPNVNPNLDSFEAVMKAMDAELSRSRTEKHGAAALKADKGKSKAVEVDKDEDIEAAMDAELKAAMERGEEEEEEEEVGEEKVDYNLIKNFLESFKSQGGLSGPVSNLAGRLQPGWTLPRDES